MSRPLKKALFGNTNFGVAGTTTDDGLGGSGIASIIQTIKGSPNLTGTLTVTMPAPAEPGGVTATVTATVTSGNITFTVTNPGSGYRAGYQAIVINSTSGQNINGAPPPEPEDEITGYLFATALTGGVSHIRITANILGLSNNTADIVRQMSSRKFLVKNANGVAAAQMHPAGAYYGGNLPDGFMFFYATDNASARYIVSKISAHKLTLVRDPTSSGWLFESGSSVKWRRAQGDGARTNADVTIDTLLN